MSDITKVRLWPRCIIVGFVVLIICWCCWWWWWRCVPCPSWSCDCPDHVEVIISDGCSPMYAAGASADPLDVDPGDIVIWTNENADTAEVSFTASTPFHTDYIVIAPGQQHVIKVLDGTGGTPPVTYEYTLKCGGTVVGNPKVSVGGGGP